MNRQHNLERLEREVFDLCIIGGGASGAGCALDAALRGLKVALVEQSDFAAGTSSKSTKLIHGGVRYLEQAFLQLDAGHLRQVRHGLEERYILLANAPHLARPIALVTPVFNSLAGLYYRAGLLLYDFFTSRKDRLPPSRWLNRKELLRRLPGLHPSLDSGVLYYDGQLDDARYCLALVQTAAESGAVVVNHTALTGFEKDDAGRLHSANVSDRLGGRDFTVRAKVFLNCTGAYADRIRQLAQPALPARIRPSKGVHLVLPAEVLQGQEALLIPKTVDGRVVFAIPFAGAILLGTTDEDHPGLDREPVLESREIDYLLDTLRPYLARPVDRSMVRAGFGGLRPLIAAKNASGTKQLLRDHEVEHDPASNLFSLLGGKWTTYRLMARDAIDAVSAQLQAPRACQTEHYLLAGAEGYLADGWQTLQSTTGWAEDICRHLHRQFGSRAPAVAALAADRPELAERLDPAYPFIGAEVVYAAREEMACTLRDVMARRLRLEILDWNAAATLAPAVSTLLGETLHWSEPEIQQAASDYAQLVRGWQRTAGLEER